MAGNPNTQLLQQRIREEYKKCMENPIHFMKKYVKIQHPIRGTIKFDLYPFQQKTLEELINHDFNIILKSRQMGISTLMAAYSLWIMIFHRDKNIMVLSINEKTAIEIVSKVRYANDNLPRWIKEEEIGNNIKTLHLKNGSKITAASSAASAGRSQALSLLILDECLGFHEHAYIRNKKTGEVRKVKIGEVYEQEEYK